VLHGIRPQSPEPYSAVQLLSNSAWRRAGFTSPAYRVRHGLNPSGPGVREIRIRDDAGAFRVVYVVWNVDVVYFLHAIHKNTQQTAQRDLEIATARRRQI
jgi:hypothetical protein